MKKTLLLVASLFASHTYSQDIFPGISQGTNTGLYGVYDNPANLAGNKKTWDVNIFSFNTGIASDFFVINDALKKVKDFKTDLSKSDFYTYNMNIDMMLPSIMLKINPQHSVAFITKLRGNSSLSGLNRQILYNVENTKSNKYIPYTIDNTDPIIVNSTTWIEYGGYWGMVLKNNEQHTFKVGASLKYITGITNGYAQIEKLKATIEQDANDDVYLTDAEAKIEAVSSGVNFIEDNEFTKISPKSFQPNGAGFGADLGITYEFKENPEDKDYKMKASLSITDLGTINFTPEANAGYLYHLKVQPTERIYFEDLKKENRKATIEKYATQKAITDRYSVALPTMLNLHGDYRFTNHLFLGIGGKIAMKNNAPRNIYKASSFNLVPRYESKFFDAYIPMEFNKYSTFNIGAYLRVGPVFLGVMNPHFIVNDTKQASVFLGLKFGKFASK